MRVFISAGEPSGDLYGSILARELKRQDPRVELWGMGGELMLEAGVKLIQGIGELGIFGFSEGVASSLVVHKTLKEVVGALRGLKPEICILIAFSGFNLLLARYLKRLGIKGVYLGPPQLWAWGRVRKYLLRRYLDRVICLFPFEEGFFKSLRINAVYLGNPLLDYVKSRMRRASLLRVYGLKPDARILTLMPGSRKEEVERHLPLMVQVFRRLREGDERVYGFAILAPGVSTTDLPRGEGLIYTREGKYEILKHSRLLIAASGTASLEAAILGTPMVVIYRLSRSSYILARLLVRLDSFALPNLIAGRRIVPELVQPRFESLWNEVIELWDSSTRLDRMRRDLGVVRERLDPPRACFRIARNILGADRS